MKNINVDLRQLRAFLAVAKHGSFTRAAEEIYLTQPGLSLMIQQLESELGVRLLDRSTRRVELTEVGYEFVSEAHRIIVDFETMITGISDFANYKRGRVSIAILPSLAMAFVSRIIARFKTTHPDIRVIIHDAFASPVIKMVETGAVDFGLGLRLQFEKDLAFKHMIADNLMVLMPVGHPLEKKDEVNWEDLIGIEVISMSRESSVRHLMDQAFAKINRTFNPTYEASYMSTAISMVDAGIGVTVLTSLALSSLKSPNVSVRSLNNPTVKRDVGIISKRNKVLSPAAQAFLDILENDTFVKNLIRDVCK